MLLHLLRLVEMDFKVEDLNELKEFMKWKRINPEEYKQFLVDLKEISKDLMTLAKELSKEME